MYLKFGGKISDICTYSLFMHGKECWSEADRTAYLNQWQLKTMTASTTAQ